MPPLDMNAHNPSQLKGSPMLKKNGHETAAVLKFMSPWRIITPPGYSTLFISPMNNPDDRKKYAEYRKSRSSQPTVINLNK